MPMLTRLAAAAALMAAAARADVICRQVDVPGSNGTQVWRGNNAGQFPATSDVGNFIYSAGAFISQPAAPAGYNGTYSLAINDFGEQAGGARPSSGGPQQGQYFDGAFHFFSGRSSSDPVTEGRGVSNAGILTAWLSPLDFHETIGVIYNPTSSTLYPSGLTVIHPPSLSDGSRANRTTPGQMNDAGRVAGGAHYPGGRSYAFIHDADGSTTLFQVNGVFTTARGVNNHDDIVGAYLGDPLNGVLRGFKRNAQGDVTTFGCGMLDASQGVFPESINDRGLITGQIIDSTGTLHGFVAFPSAAAELADLLGLVEEVGPGASLESKLRAAQASLSRGDGAASCASLDAFVAEVKAQSGRHVDRQVATSFISEAQSIAAALGCR